MLHLIMALADVKCLPYIPRPATGQVVVSEYMDTNEGGERVLGKARWAIIITLKMWFQGVGGGGRTA